jgi:two-component system chemotaxis response regulator CheB
MIRNRIKVLIVDDSAFFREMLIQKLRQDDGLEVVGFAVDSYDAFDKIAMLNPDVVTLDVEMPGMDGVEFLRKLIPKNPLPVVVVSSRPDRALDALDAGAVDFVKKPEVRSSGGSEEFFRELRAKVKIASIARLARLHTRAGSRAPARKRTVSDLPGAGAALSSGVSRPETALSRLRYRKPDKPRPETESHKAKDIEVIAIGASTGGTDAIVEVLCKLPPDSPCVLVVQHMPPGFTSMYAQRLDSVCQMSVKECEDGDRVIPGRVIIAAGGYHMRLAKDANGFFVRKYEGPKVSGHCPSVNTLFDSVAEAAGNKAIGVILTGMGSDGAKGLLKIRLRGGYTIGQDRDSCVVYGMPMAAHNIGAVVKQLPLERIGEEIIHQVRTRSEYSQ